MRKVLLPVDGSCYTTKILERAKSLFDSKEVQITLLTVVNTPMHYKYDFEYKNALHHSQKNLENYAEMLSAYQVSTSVVCGRPGVSIVRFAKQNNFDCVLMTRSFQGSAETYHAVSSYVVKKAPFLELLILPEDAQRQYA